MFTESTLIGRRMQVTCCAAMVMVMFALDPAGAQEKDDKSPAAAAAQSAAAEKPETESGEQAEEKDPFAVPDDATVEELFEFIRSVKKERGRTLESVSKSARAAVAGAEAIRNLQDVGLDDETKAIREQLSALSFLQRYDRKSAEQLKSLVSALKNDKRPEIAWLGAIEAFKLSSNAARSASKEDQIQLIAELKKLLAGREFNREAYSLATGLARAIGYSDNSDVAASLYEDLARWMSESEDKSLQERAGKMLGAARRMRLPSNFMEVMGTTTLGEEFDWDAYRGKVVLVDFWASWCGPCRGEVPNMKRNLAAYSDRGFEIVGVNLDRTLEACEKYVEQEELSWANLMSDKDGERGWDNPLAAHYGISAIPTAILVDQEGKVVSLAARGEELDRLLGEMLGAPAPSEEEAAPKVAEKLEDGDT